MVSQSSFFQTKNNNRSRNTRFRCLLLLAALAIAILALAYCSRPIAASSGRTSNNLLAAANWSAIVARDSSGSASKNSLSQFSHLDLASAFFRFDNLNPLTAAPAPMTFTVTNTNTSGAGSLQQAIVDANANPGPDMISFNIPGTDPNCDATTKVCTITPTGGSQLPQIASPVTIDGYTQPGASKNTLSAGDNAVILIEISGALINGNG